MKKYLYMSLAVAIFLFAAAEKSFACSCVFTPDPVKKKIQQAFEGSTAIFSGEVLEIKDSPANKYDVVVKLKVGKSWKGEPGTETTITTARDSAMCGYNFEVGKTYLVYAGGAPDALAVNNCSRTTGASLKSKQSDVKYLAKLKPKKPVLLKN